MIGLKGFSIESGCLTQYGELNECAMTIFFRVNGKKINPVFRFFRCGQTRAKKAGIPSSWHSSFDLIDILKTLWKRKSKRFPGASFLDQPAKINFFSPHLYQFVCIVCKSNRIVVVCANNTYEIIMFSETIAQIASEGRSSFSFEELKQRRESSQKALKSALRRSLKKRDIAMPYRGFYVIIPPEYRSLGCLPAEQFIPDLMDYLEEIYYAGLLSAAEYHGAAHHRPQVFQVVVTKPRRAIKCGRTRINFIVKKNAEAMPSQQRNTPTGILKLSSPEVTAFDIVGYYRHCGWLDNVATVLAELAEKLDDWKLAAIAESFPIAWAQRLGYLLEKVGAEKCVGSLAKYIENQSPVRTPLLPSAGIKGSKLNRHWRVFVNAEVEAEV